MGASRRRLRTLRRSPITASPIRYVPSCAALSDLLDAAAASDMVEVVWYVAINKKKEVIPMGVAVPWPAHFLRGRGGHAPSFR